MEGDLRPGHDRAHRAWQGCRGAGADHAERKVACRRLPSDAACRLAWRNRLEQLPHHRHHFDCLGHGRRRHHRYRVAADGWRRCKVRAAMNELVTHPPVIAARDLTKRYGAASAVDHISFVIDKGEVFGLLGPNGAGKTTTILMM